MSDRYFTNHFPDYDTAQPVLIDQEYIKELIAKYVKEILENTDPRNHSLSSLKRPDLYVGLAGIAFMFYKLAKSPLQHDYPALECAKIYADAAEELLKINGTKKFISLLSGNAGVHAVSAAVNHSIGRSTEKDIKNLLKGIKIFDSPEYLDDGQDEMLVGRSGYLLGINWLSKEVQSPVIAKDEHENLAKIVILSGRNYARTHKLSIPLMYQYHGREYLGAAHGISAILLSLLQVDLDQDDLQDVKATIDKILLLQDDSGNFPSKYNKPEAHLVHWCHGAPGMIYLMAKAFKAFNEQKYLNSCEKCGDVVWTKGFLKKGPGMCHGIASSGYTHLMLYRLTNNRKYLYRAFKCAEFLSSEEFLKEAREPDRPYSLFEGISGTVCFLVDLLNHDDAEFPFMNVF